MAKQRAPSKRSSSTTGAKRRAPAKKAARKKTSKVTPAPKTAAKRKQGAKKVASRKKVAAKKAPAKKTPAKKAAKKKPASRKPAQKGTKAKAADIEAPPAASDATEQAAALQIDEADATMGGFLRRLEQNLTDASRTIFGIALLLAQARKGETRGILSSRTLLFALGLVDTEQTIERVRNLLSEDLTREFSRIVADGPFFGALSGAFDRDGIPVLPNRELAEQALGYDLYSAADVPLSGNLQRVLKRAVEYSAQLGSDLQPAHLLLGLLALPGPRVQSVLEDIGRPIPSLCKGLIDQLPRYVRPEQVSPISKTLASIAAETGDTEATTAGTDRGDQPNLSEIASSFDSSTRAVFERAGDWSVSQQRYSDPVLTPTILLIAMLEVYRGDFRSWGENTLVWSMAAERILSEPWRYERWQATVMNPGFQPGLNGSGPPFESLMASRGWDAGFETLLRTAHHLSKADLPSGEPGLDHVFAAMLREAGLESHAVLEQLGVATSAGIAFITDSLPDLANHEHWSGFLSEVRQTLADTAHPSVPIAAPYAADSPDADDLLDVEGEAMAFARYIAKQELDTPLAIGLFGDWGSGKSFFMRRMARFVGDLEGTGEPWCSNIVQVEFNAWHYMEGNLWASLVEHILSALEDWSRDESKEKEIESLFQQFESAREVQRESEENLQTAQDARDDAEDELRRARSELQEKIDQRGQLNTRTLWTAINNGFQASLAKTPHLRTKLSEASKTLGLTELDKSAQELAGVVSEAGATRSRARLVLGSLIARERRARGWVLFVATIALAPFAAGALWTWLSASSDLPARIGAGVAELSALVSVVVAWVGRGIATANAALSEIEEASASLDDIVRSRTSEQDKALAKKEAEVATANERLDKAEGRLSQARAAVDEAQRALLAESPRGRLTRFLRSRLDNADYSRHLGVVSMIRKDFELLSSIMTEPDWIAQNPGKLKDLDDDVVAESLKTFDRIVLYIDDLDRCPAEKVVAVLQAVHLLLAFPLFVVVVGVDARWISRSLVQHYPHLLNEDAIAGASDEHKSKEKESGDENEKSQQRSIKHIVASSHDYLEKIFQVPYWVKPMDEEASKNFLEGLARQANGSVEAEEAPGDEANDTNNTDETSGAAQEPETGAGDIGLFRLLPGTADAGAPDPSPKASEAGSATDEQGLEEEIHRDVGQPAAPDASGQQRDELRELLSPRLADSPLSDFEIMFMKTLAPSVGRSPRRSKRFFNVYQLIRAGLSDKERSRFVGGRGQGSGYRIVMVLLAINTGSPMLAPKFFEALLDKNVCEADDLVACFSDNEEFTGSSEWPRLSAALSVLNGVGHSTERAEWLRYWARRTMRFSFSARPIADFGQQVR